MSLTIHMMTAALSAGDAIGNYVRSLTRILQGWGCQVRLYADHVNVRYPLPHAHSSTYQPTGRDILWMHYSIYTDNVHWVQDSPDFTILDSHNVSPPELFAGYDPVMEDLCRRGEALLGTLPRHVDLTVVHTDYVRRDLRQRGFRTLRTLPLVVDTQRFTGQGAPQWERLLAPLDYLLFVGRIAPQKNLKLALRVFAALRRLRPGVQFFLVGGQYLPTYTAELEALAAELGIADAVVLTGLLPDAEELTSFLRHARFSLTLSVWESFCVPIVESLYFGTPVFGHAVEPIPETMGAGGVLLEGDPAQMAAQMHALWDNTARYATLQAQGQAHAQRFTDQQLHHTLLALFDELARGEVR